MQLCDLKTSHLNSVAKKFQQSSFRKTLDVSFSNAFDDEPSQRAKRSVSESHNVPVVVNKGGENSHSRCTYNLQTSFADSRGRNRHNVNGVKVFKLCNHRENRVRYVIMRTHLPHRKGVSPGAHAVSNSVGRHVLPVKDVGLHPLGLFNLPH